jgi:hypothetical protein
VVFLQRFHLGLPHSAAEAAAGQQQQRFAGRVAAFRHKVSRHATSSSRISANTVHGFARAHPF